MSVTRKMFVWSKFFFCSDCLRSECIPTTTYGALASFFFFFV